MDFKIRCFVCHNEVSSLGVASHVKKHKITIAEFKRQYIDSLVNTGISEQIKAEYLQLTSLFELSKKYCIPINYLKNLFVFLDTPLINFKKTNEIIWQKKSQQIVNDYVKNNIDIKTLSEMYKISCKFLQTKLKKHFRDKINNRQEKKLLQLIKDNNFEIIFDDYQKGISLRELEIKYALNRDSIKKVFKYCGKTIKNSKEAINASTKYKKQIGTYSIKKTKESCSGHVPWYLINNNKLQGLWEAKFALWLSDNNIDFKCHFKFESLKYRDDSNLLRTYHPDFKILTTNKFFDKDCFIEIKGVYSEKDKNKMKLVREQHKDKKIILLEYEQLYKLGVFEIDKKLKIDLVDRRINPKNNAFFVDEIIKTISVDSLLKSFLVDKLSHKELIITYNIIDFMLLKRVFEKLKIPLNKTSKEYSLFCLDYYNKNFGDQILKKYFLDTNYRKIHISFPFISCFFIKKILQKNGINNLKDTYLQKYSKEQILRQVVSCKSFFLTSKTLKISRKTVEEVAINALEKILC